MPAHYRTDPYLNFRFLLKVDDRYVAGMSQVSGLTRSITLHRGVSHDPDFQQWCTGPSRDVRKDIVLEIHNEEGEKVMAYHISRCRPSQCISIPELDGTGNALVIQSLTLENEGWEPVPLPV